MSKQDRSRSTRRPPVGPRDKLWVIVAVAAVLVVAGIATASAALGAGGLPQGYPPAKATELAQQQQAIATARAHPKSKDGPAPVFPSPQPTATFQAGINTHMHEGPFSASQFTVRDAWLGQVDSTWENVYAGGFTNPDGSVGQGALKIYTALDQYIGTYTAPAGSAALTITAVNGDVMQLRTDSGVTLTFNLQTHLYG